MKIRRAQPAESREVQSWIARHHYTRTAPPGYILALEFLLERRRIGAALLGRPTSREVDAASWMELTRLVFVDDTPPMVESRALGLMRKYVRTWMPGIRGLLAYSDPEVGHEGTIYRADGWAPFGRTKRQREGWRSREGRRPPAGVTYSRKDRWIRTP